MNQNELDQYLSELTNETSIYGLPSRKRIANKDLPEKMTIVDFAVISEVIPSGWRIANNDDLKEMYTVKDKAEFNFDIEEVYISLDNLDTLATGVLFFDDGEFDVRTNKLFAGKVRLIRD